MAGTDARRAREMGVVYTPATVTRPMVAKALEPFVATRTPDQLAELRICDPAVGTGAFAIAAVEYLAEHLDRERAERCIVGVDIDGGALAVAQQRLPNSRFIVGDALDLTWAEPFDVVIGNPPYVRQERLADRKPRLRSFEVYDGVADLYVYFVELAHRLLRPAGRYCLIVPDKWLTAEYARPLRSYLARQASLEGVIDFARTLPLFDGADAFPCIVWGQVPATNTPSLTVLASRATESLDLDAGIPHARARWRDEPWHIDTEADRALIDRLEAAFPALGSLVDKPSRGVITGCNRAFVVDGATRARIVAEDPEAADVILPFVKGRDIRRHRVELADRFVILADHDRPLPRGCLEHLAQFRDELEPKPEGHVGPWSGRKPGAYRWYELQDPVGPLVAARRPRLLYQDIQTEPACALDHEGLLVPDTTVWMLPTDDTAILAILSSSLYRWYARRRFPPALNGAVRPKRSYIARLPIAQDPQLDESSLDDHVFDAYGLSLDERALIAADQDDARPTAAAGT